MGKLEDKVAIITGGAGGIGKAAARKYLAEGSKVLLVDLDEEALKQAVEELASNQVSYFAADVTDPAQSQDYVNAAVERYGGVDVYLANAGIEGMVAPIEEYDLAMFDKVLAVNVRGVWLGIKSVFPELKKRGGGSIVITSSVAGIKGSAGISAYNTSKHAVIGMMRSMAMEGAPHNIRVNTVNPSPVETRMMRSLEAGFNPEDAEAAHQGIASNIPLGRYGEPEDIANLMAFLAADDSAFLTGGVYMADGGISAN
ncbi:MAG: glucose 1-dehydrogenase [Pseudomonadales bacterium]|nr:glucose 1-dehydrogenase [Pseudomonadales bacterium]